MSTSASSNATCTGSTTAWSLLALWQAFERVERRRRDGRLRRPLRAHEGAAHLGGAHRRGAGVRRRAAPRREGRARLEHPLARSSDLSNVCISRRYAMRSGDHVLPLWGWGSPPACEKKGKATPRISSPSSCRRYPVQSGFEFSPVLPLSVQSVTLVGVVHDPVRWPARPVRRLAKYHGGISCLFTFTPPVLPDPRRIVDDVLAAGRQQHGRARH